MVHLMTVILELSEHKIIRRLLKIHDPEKSSIVQNMRDCELVLRFFALKDDWGCFSGSMNKTLNSYMEKNRHADIILLNNLKSIFLDTLEAVESGFGDKAFLRWDKKRRHWGNTAVAAMFDAEMLACVGFSANSIYEKREYITDKLQTAFEEDRFVEAVSAGTNQPSKLVIRVSVVRNIITDSIGG